MNLRKIEVQPGITFWTNWAEFQEARAALEAEVLKGDLDRSFNLDVVAMCRSAQILFETEAAGWA